MMRKGSFVALVTPMTQEGDVDFEALKTLIDWHVRAGSSGLVVGGSTGESVSLTDDEFSLLVKTTVSYVNGRIPVIAGTGTAATASSIVRTETAAACGVDAALVVTPYYNKPTQKGLIAHYCAITEAVPSLPLILYNVPERTASCLAPETVFELSTLPSIIGLKDSLPDMARLEKIRVLCGDGFLLYSGDDMTCCEYMSRGGDGVISVTANALPELLGDLCMLSLDGQGEEARALQQKLMPFHQALFVESNPIPVKYVLHKMGKVLRGIRAPLTWLDEKKQSEINRLILDWELI